MPTQYVRFSGAADLRMRLVCATLSGRALGCVRAPAPHATAAAAARLASPDVDRAGPAIGPSRAPSARARSTTPSRARADRAPPFAAFRALVRVLGVSSFAAFAWSLSETQSGRHPREGPEPRLRDYEASLLRLLDKLTNGMAVDINESGTALKYKPGVVVGGRRVAHDCGGGRAVGYFLEPILLVSLFAKKPLDLTLTGITNDEGGDVGGHVPHRHAPDAEAAVRAGGGSVAANRAAAGAPPGAGGEIVLKLPILKELKTIDWTDEGLVKRVRGVAFTLRLSPQTGNRLVDAARGVLNKFLPDVYIFTDHHPGDGREGGRGAARGKRARPDSACRSWRRPPRAACSARTRRQARGGRRGKRECPPSGTPPRRRAKTKTKTKTERLRSAPPARAGGNAAAAIPRPPRIWARPRRRR